MRAILVDDEPLALVGLQKKIEREFRGSLEIVETFTNPAKVVSGVLEHRPDVVFLDIEMPGIDGLSLGRQIQNVSSDTEIVFVTSYEQYAVEAFELYALDYLTKPVPEERLHQTILRLQKKMSYKSARPAPDTSRPIIRCFNQLQFQLPGMEAKSVKWRTSKAQELFAYLLHHRDRVVHRSVLLELLWPDLEADKAAKQLYSAIYFIRKTLKQHQMDMISIQNADLEVGYRLNIGKARVDAEEWESAIKRIAVLDASTAETCERILNDYSGHYLGNHDYLWAEHERERLRLLWLHHMRKLSEFYARQGSLQKSVQLYRRIQQLLPDEEESYFSLMKIYDSIGDRIGVEEQYLLLKTKLERELDMPISPSIHHWYDSWKLKDAVGGKLP